MNIFYIPVHFHEQEPNDDELVMLRQLDSFLCG